MKCAHPIVPPGSNTTRWYSLGLRATAFSLWILGSAGTRHYPRSCASVTVFSVVVPMRAHRKYTSPLNLLSSLVNKNPERRILKHFDVIDDRNSHELVQQRRTKYSIA